MGSHIPDWLRVALGISPFSGSADSCCPAGPVFCWAWLRLCRSSGQSWKKKPSLVACNKWTEVEEKSLNTAAPQVEELCSQGSSVGFWILMDLCNKYVVPRMQEPQRHQTVIIFDWDDTLLCTTFLKSCRAITPLVELALDGIEQITRQLLTQSSELGQTFIITNAAEGWVEYSTAAFIPELLPVLQAVEVISARSRYEMYYPTEVHQWKTQTFLEVQRQMDTRIITNLISIGDSEDEMDAVHCMGQQFQKALTKTIKFAEEPSPEELLRQLGKLAEKFDRIVESTCNLQIGISGGR